MVADERIEAVFDGGTTLGLGPGELLARFAARRDEAAFAALVARHGPMVLATCRRILPDGLDADDAFQATFLVLARRAAAVDAGRLGPWLHGVARRVAVRARGAAARRRAVEGGDLPDVPAPPAADGAADLRAVLDEELARLPAKYRAPLVLCYLEGRTHDEAADQLAWPVGTVRSRLARGRDRLRGGLARRGYAPGALAILSPATLPPAAVSPLLRSAAVRLALAPTAGLPAGSAAVLLAEGTLRTMLTAQIQAIAALVAAGLAVAGVGTLAAPRGAEPPAAAAVANPDAGSPQAPPAAGVPAEVTNKYWDVADFTDVEIRSSFQAEIFRGDHAGVAPSNRFEVCTIVETHAADLVRVVRDGRTLRVDFARDRDVRVNEPLRVKIWLPALAGVALFEAAHATLTGEPATDRFQARLGGASRLDGTIRAHHADFTAGGASTLALRGGAEEATVAASGGAKLLLADFALGDSKIKLEGGSRAEVAVKSAGPFGATLEGGARLEGSVEAGPLDIRVEGAGRVDLAGKARDATLRAAGAARIDLARLIATTASVQLDGTASAVVDATARLTYRLGSASRLEYLGQPADLEGKATPGAKLKRRD